MSYKKYKLETISAHSNVLVVKTQHKISSAVIDKLNDLDKIKTEVISEFPVLLKTKPNAVIYILPSHLVSSKVIQLLNFCYKNSLLLTIVLPETGTESKRIFQKLIREYSATHQLVLNVIEADYDKNVHENSTRIISSLVYGYRNTNKILPPEDITQRIETIKNKKPKKSNILKILFIACLPYILLSSLLLFGIITSYLSMFWYGKNEVSKTIICSNLTVSLVNIIRPLAKVLPGINLLEKKTGIRLDRIQDLYQSINTSQKTHLQLVTSIFNSNNINNLSLLNSVLLTNSESFGLLQANLKDLYLTSPGLSGMLLKIAEKIALTRSDLAKLFDVINELNEIKITDHLVGLVVLQNPDEIRSSGGVIENIIVIYHNPDGTIKTQSFSVSDTDALLVGQVNPPPDFQQVTGFKNWYLKDAGWDADFPTVAKKIAWFVNKEISVSADYVIAVNRNDYQKLISFFKTDQKNMSATKKSKALEFIFRQLESRQISGYFINPRLLSLEKVGWDGSIKNTSCQTVDPCVFDYHYALSNSIGNNQINQFVKNSRRLEINFGSKKIDTHVEYFFQNDNPDQQQKYKNYFRIYLPKSVVIDNVSLNGNPLSLDSYSVAYEHNLLVVGVTVDVSPGSTTQIFLNYYQNILSDNSFRYQIDIPIQPGVSKNNQSVTITYPPEWSVKTYVTAGTPVSPVATAGQLRYNSDQGQISKLYLDITRSQ